MGRARRANVAIFTRWLRGICTKRCTGTRHAFTPAQACICKYAIRARYGQTPCVLHAEIKSPLPAALQSRITVVFVAAFSGNKEDGGYIIGTIVPSRRATGAQHWQVGASQLKAP